MENKLIYVLNLVQYKVLHTKAKYMMMNDAEFLLKRLLYYLSDTYSIYIY